MPPSQTPSFEDRGCDQCDPLPYKKTIVFRANETLRFALDIYRWRRKERQHQMGNSVRQCRLVLNLVMCLERRQDHKL